MNSPSLAIVWELWRRGRRLVWIPPACLAFCTFLNLVLLDRLHVTERGDAIVAVFGWLMAISLLVLMGIFNYTEYSATKEWHGFPYRLFTLPIPTWKLVALPMVLGAGSLQLLYWGWIKLVWTNPHPALPEWYGAVLGGFLVFYQTVLWSLAGFRIARIMMLSLGGVAGVGIACIPLGLSAQDKPGMPWERALIAVMAAMGVVGYLIAWGIVARQRSGGGRRQNWFKALQESMADILPRRRRDFGSPAAAQFWFEWRRAGFVLPASVMLVILVVLLPTTWVYREDAKVTKNSLLMLLAAPLVLALVTGKGFASPDLWSSSSGFPAFQRVRPLPTGEFIISKMKVAALAAALTWLLVFGFMAVWLRFWAEPTELKLLFNEFRLFYPQSWHAITGLYLAGFMVLTWRFMVSGFWIGMSGNKRLQLMVVLLQVIVPIILLVACGILSDNLDRTFQNHPDWAAKLSIRLIAWGLALAVIGKFWLAAFSWSRICPKRAQQYFFIWPGATVAFVALAILSRPLLDTYRQEQLYLLAALLVFPLARLGLAPAALARNRHQ